MFYTIYKTTNLINGKIYIGKHQTKDLNDGYLGSGKHLKNAINKYGIENFKKEILFQFDNESDMNDKESELVTEEFCLREDVYNICIGGKGGFSYIRNHDKYVNWQLKGAYAGAQTNLKKDNIFWKKLSKAGNKALKQKLVENGGAWWNTNGFEGKLHSEETKEKMAKPKNQGNKNSQFGTMWITNGNENKKIKKDIDIIPEGWYKGRKIK